MPQNVPFFTKLFQLARSIAEIGVIEDVVPGKHRIRDVAGYLFRRFLCDTILRERGYFHVARSNSPEALTKHGYSLQDVKEWRKREHEAGRPSGLDDFFRAHGLCVECGGHGMLVVGVRWLDATGIEQMERGPVAALVQRHNLQKPHETAHRDKSDWDYLYETCVACKGTGQQTANKPSVDC